MIAGGGNGRGHPARYSVDVRPLEDGDRGWVRQLALEEWGLPVVSPSGCHDPATLDGFVAEAQGRFLGVTTYRLVGDECEVVTLNSLEEGRGVGTALLAAVKRVADEHGARLWLITSDDNQRAIGFYNARGMAVRGVHRGFIDVVRRHKPGVAPNAFSDAIEFAYEGT